jgi:hypothetical protein
MTRARIGRVGNLSYLNYRSEIWFVQVALSHLFLRTILWEFEFVWEPNNDVFGWWHLLVTLEYLTSPRLLSVGCWASNLWIDRSKFLKVGRSPQDFSFVMAPTFAKFENKAKFEDLDSCVHSLSKWRHAIQGISRWIFLYYASQNCLQFFLPHIGFSQPLGGTNGSFGLWLIVFCGAKVSSSSRVELLTFLYALVHERVQ